MNELEKISVTLANRKYILSVEKKDELLIRNASENINGQISQFMKQYPGKDIQDILSMILLNYAASLAKEENGTIGLTKELHYRLEKISQLLAKAV